MPVLKKATPRSRRPPKPGCASNSAHSACSFPTRPISSSNWPTALCTSTASTNFWRNTKVRGGGKALKELRLQVAAWNDVLQREVLPKARQDFRLPDELYAVRLRTIGVDIPPAELAARARTAFIEIRNQMVALAPLVTRKHKLKATDYPSVIRELRAAY